MLEASCRLRPFKMAVPIVLGGLLVASCAQQRSAPEQIQASDPSVTYKYHNDQELVQANHSAMTFCDRYGSYPRTANIKNDSDGGRVIVFECAPAPQAATAALPQTTPSPAYTYRTDQELLDASRNAQIYCRNKGAQRLTTNVVVNPDGTKTVAFQCAAP